MERRVHISQQKQEGPGAKFKARGRTRQGRQQLGQHLRAAKKLQATETEQSSSNRSRRSRKLNSHKSVRGS